MSTVPTTMHVSVQSQRLSHLVTSATVTDKAANSESSKGDQVTISEKGKQLAKTAVEKGNDGALTAVTSGLTVNKVKIAQNLQDAKGKQKSLTAKIEQEKAQGGDVGGLNAQLADVNKTISKIQVQTNQ